MVEHYYNHINCTLKKLLFYHCLGGGGKRKIQSQACLYIELGINVSYIIFYCKKNSSPEEVKNFQNLNSNNSYLLR